MTPSSGEITMILQRWDSDRHAAVDALTPIVYAELRKIAASYLRNQRPDHTLQPTALINEAYLRLIRQDSASLKDRSHFYALAARMMRQILVDSARARNSGKRRAGNQVPLDERMEPGGGHDPMEFITIHEALQKLQEHNARMADAVELRYFGGMQPDEIARRFPCRWRP